MTRLERWTLVAFWLGWLAFYGTITLIVWAVS